MCTVLELVTDHEKLPNVIKPWILFCGYVLRGYGDLDLLAWANEHDDVEVQNFLYTEYTCTQSRMKKKIMDKPRNFEPAVACYL